MTEEEFGVKLAQMEFLEWENVHGFRYGTLRAPLEAALKGGETHLLDVDVKGGVNIKREYPSQTVTIFIEPPDLETLKKRLARRGTEGAAEIRRRLARIDQEQSYRDRYDHVVVNDELEQAVMEIETLVQKE